MKKLKKIPSLSIPENLDGCLYDLKQEVNRIKFEEKIEYFNCTNHDMMVRRRDGLVIPILRGNGAPYVEQAFIVRKTLTVVDLLGGHLADAIRRTKTANVEHHAVGHRMLEVLDMSSQYSTPYCSRHSVEIVYVVKEDDIHKHGGVVYVPEIDLVVQCTDDASKVCYHPFSKEYNYLSELQGLEKIIEEPHERMGGVLYRIIDNTGEYGDRYINIDGIPLKVPALESDRLANGVYTYHLNKATTGKFSKMACEYYTYERANKQLRLFKTYHEAANYQENEKTRLEINNSQLERMCNEQKESIALMKHKLEVDKLEHEKELAIRKRELEEARAQLEMLRFSNEREKARQDRVDKQVNIMRQSVTENLALDRSIKKDILESWKILLPLLISVFGTFYKGYQRLRER